MDPGEEKGVRPPAMEMACITLTGLPITKSPGLMASATFCQRPSVKNVRALRPPMAWLTMLILAASKNGAMRSPQPNAPFVPPPDGAKVYRVVRQGLRAGVAI